ncbi:MAG: DUF1116 domain-containing protein [Christensenellales bacterium]|jgi:hypothetical protein
MKSIKEKVRAANDYVIERMQETDPYWVGMKPAIECVPDIHQNLILHSGPAITWEDMCETQKQGIVNGALHEGLAKTEEEAREKLASGEIEFAAGNDYHVVVPGSGIATPTMVLNIVEDRHTGAKGFCAPFEGPNRGGLAGWGIYNPAIKAHLNNMHDHLGPAFDAVLKKTGGLGLKRMIIRGVEMGDELHSRQDACDLILLNELMKLLYDSDLEHGIKTQCVELLYGTVRFFHPLGMAAAMSLLEGIRDVPYSTVITAMMGNGVSYGIKIAGLGNQWFTAPAPKLEGSYVSTDIDMNDVLPWIGDSCILEACGLGGSAAAAAPAVMRAQNLTLEDGIERSREIEQITLATHRYYLIPALDYQGSPLGIDMRKVLRTGIAPVVHGGIISKSGKRLGAGVAHVPTACFEKACYAYGDKYGL